MNKYVNNDLSMTNDQLKSAAIVSHPGDTFELSVGQRIWRPLRKSNAPEKSRYVCYAEGKIDRRVILIEDTEAMTQDDVDHVGDFALLEITMRHPSYYKGTILQLKEHPITSKPEMSLQQASTDNKLDVGRSDVMDTDDRRTRMTFYFKVGGEIYYLPVSKFPHYSALKKFAQSIKIAADEGERAFSASQNNG